uniref:Uncharacterized protein n=1 Tax=Panagrolaimus sp. JU765 TaxID=591449 RepID=A0AC34Q8P1_9BILA
MSPKNQKKQNPDAIAIQLIGIASLGNYCVAYDLKDGSVWKKFDLPRAIYKNGDWATIFKLLTKECPPNIVKSVFVNMLAGVKVPNYDVWVVRVKKQAIKYGYSNFCWSTNLVLRMVLVLLEAKKKGKKYEIGDCIVLADYLLMPFGTSWCHIYILKRQEIGWDVVDGDLAEMDKFLPPDFQHYGCYTQ